MIITSRYQTNISGVITWFINLSYADALALSTDPDNALISTTLQDYFISQDLYSGNPTPFNTDWFVINLNSGTNSGTLKLVFPVGYVFPNGIDIFDINSIQSNSVNPNTNITISLQPILDSLRAAYRPVVFRCTASISAPTPTNYIPPIVYCDIYVDGVYYKTITRTSFINNNGSTPEYEFDVQDAIQELMEYNLPAIDQSSVLTSDKTIKTVFVKFRNGKYDSNGFIYSEQIAPVQGTSTTTPISGAGVQSNTVYVVNSTLQHEENQNLSAFLNSYKTGTWDADTYPLTKRPENYKMCKTDSSYFPLVTDKTIKCLVLNYRPDSVSSYSTAQFCTVNTLVITNVVHISGNTYRIFYTSDFPITALSITVSSDESSWTTLNPITGTTSPIDVTFSDPQELEVTAGGTFYLRIRDYDGATGILSNSFFFETTVTCVAPTLESVIKTQGSDELTAVWSTNGFDYLSGHCELQYSVDDGITWTSISPTVPSNDETGVWSVTGITFGAPIKYRLICMGNTCTMVSNVIESIYANEFEYTLDIFWADNNGTEDRDTFAASVDIGHSGIYFPESGLIFKRKEGSDWVDVDGAVTNPMTLPLEEGVNEFYLRLVNEFGDSVASNILKFTVTVPEFQFMLRGNAQLSFDNACGTTLLFNCKAQLQDFPIVQLGDRIFTSSEVPFSGANKYFKIQSIFADSSDPVYSVQIDNDGWVIGDSTCAPIPED